MDTAIEMALHQAFYELGPWLLGCLLVIGIFGLVSLVPARRGHWSALILAAPPLLVGAYFIWGLVACLMDVSQRKNLWSEYNLVFVPFPLLFVLGVVSVRRWAMCRRVKRAQPNQDLVSPPLF